MTLPTLVKLDLAAFVATKHQPSAQEFSELVKAFAEEGRSISAQEACILYADGFLIEVRADRFYPYAWWYPPIQHSTLESAEADLHKWRQEWE